MEAIFILLLIIFLILFILLFIFILYRKCFIKIFKKLHFKIDLVNSFNDELNKNSKKLEIVVVNNGKYDLDIRSLGIELFKLKIDTLIEPKSLSNDELLVISVELDKVKQIISNNLFNTPRKIKFYLKDSKDQIYYSKSLNLKSFL